MEAAQDFHLWSWLDQVEGIEVDLAEWLITERTLLVSRSDRPPRKAPVEISTPREQELFIESLHAALLEGGLLDEQEPAGWYEARLAQERKAARIQRYLQGPSIPTDKSLIALLVSVTTGPRLDTLLDLAAEARAARVRDRRAARDSRKS
ncbi:hypothetical protein OG581_26675 [Streptomyces sp. NBC_01386]|uniref:hypothetical protein n=1 Tax=Streptomyces sp. NBC_01386 TaxID=2903848 RepID=UPI0032551E94